MGENGTRTRSLEEFDVDDNKLRQPDSSGSRPPRGLGPLTKVPSQAEGTGTFVSLSFYLSR